ncbi:MAG TPA: alpha/beta fold hydrolase [Thermomicrobiales bacterium]|nr:alpha/beta fold hydrolase [Thermomicrobiales bacterium]
MAAIIFLLALAYVVPAYFAVRAMTAMDRVPLSSSPADHGLAFESVAFPSRDGITLRGWWIDGGGPQTVIMAHGKGSVRDDAGLMYLELAAGLARAGHDVLLFDLRGHGESDFGRFTIGVNEPRDVLGAVDFARARGVPVDKIALLGFSTGAVAALEAAVQEPGVGAVIADGAWPDLRELLDREMATESPLPSFYNPGIYLVARLVFGWDVSEQVAIDDVTEIVGSGRPVFVIHGSGDQYTSVEQAARFAAAIRDSPNAEFWQITGAEHVSGYASYPDEYLARLLAFLSRTIGKTVP